MTYPNYQESENSPELPEGEYGIFVCFSHRAEKAEFALSEPWPLYAAYRVDKNTLDEFGHELDSHILIVVQQKEGRGIFTGRVLKDDPPPRKEDATGEPETGGRRISHASYFAIDLKTQCRIPEQPGKYWVVVLLGTISSQVLEFEVR